MNNIFQSETCARWTRGGGRLALASIVGIGATLLLVLGVKIAQAAPPEPYCFPAAGIA